MKKIFKKTFLIFAILTACTAAQAKNISPEEAQETATRFLAQATATRATAPLQYIGDSNSILGATRATAEPTFYIFANDNNFVIVAGDDCARPILGYSQEGGIKSTDNMPDAMREWLADIDRKITAAREKNTVTRAATDNYDTTMGNVVKQLETARWGQGYPFNKQCFTFYGEQASTGCVPTAFAIVMRYHKWPQKGTGTIKWATDTDGDRSTSEYTITAYDLTTHTYDWDNMPLIYTEGEYTDEQADAVSLIMADLGKAFGVDYGTGGTGGSHNSATPAKYFGYVDAGMTQRWQVGDDEWVRLIKESIDSLRPVPYAATNSGTYSDGRHIFVLDGYTDNDYYHFNWGWVGNFNGYFTLTAMHPTSGDDYGTNTTSHQAYFQFRPLIENIEEPDEGEETAIEYITTDPQNNSIYDLNGKKTEKPTKGIYIKNGKKIIIR